MIFKMKKRFWEISSKRNWCSFFKIIFLATYGQFSCRKILCVLFLNRIKFYLLIKFSTFSKLARFVISFDPFRNNFSWKLRKAKIISLFQMCREDHLFFSNVPRFVIAFAAFCNNFSWRVIKAKIMMNMMKF